MASCLIYRYRGLAVLVRAYRNKFQFERLHFVDTRQSFAARQRIFGTQCIGLNPHRRRLSQD